MQPPLLPEETLARVYRLARFDGTGVLLLSGLFALLSASTGDYIGTAAGLAVAAAGAIELHGTQLLRHGEPRGMRWLVGSQFVLMAGVLAYCTLRLLSFSPDLIDYVLTPDLRATFLKAGYRPDELNELVRRIYYLTYSAVAVVTLLYQGGMALYYARRREPVAQALAADGGEDA